MHEDEILDDHLSPQSSYKLTWTSMQFYSIYLTESLSPMLSAQ